MDTNNTTLYNIIRNGSFENDKIPGEYDSVAEYWSFLKYDMFHNNQLQVQRLYLDDIESYACGISINGCDIKEDGIGMPIGIYQEFLVPRASWCSRLRISFDAKLIDCLIYNKIQVRVYANEINPSNIIYNSENIDDLSLDSPGYGKEGSFWIGEDWTRCSVDVNLYGHNNCVYYLLITGYPEPGYGYGGYNEGISRYHGITFLVKDIQSYAEYCYDFASNILEDPDKSSNWKKIESGNHRITESKEDGKTYFNVKGNRGYESTLRKETKLPIVYDKDNDSYHIDLQFSYRIAPHSQLEIFVYNSKNYSTYSNKLLDRTIYGAENDKEEWKTISFSSQSLDPDNRIESPYSQKTILDYVYVRFRMGNMTSDSSYGCDVDIGDIRLNLFSTLEVESTGNDGTFAHPYTDKDGRLLYGRPYTQFKFYSGEDVTKSSIYCKREELDDGSYKDTLYMLDSRGYLCENEFYDYNGETYFILSDGRIAYNQYFTYNNKVYRADENGKCTFLYNKLYYIDIMYKGYKVNSRRVEAIMGPIEFELQFPEQNSAVGMTVRGANGDSVIKKIEVTPGKKSNKISILTECGLDDLVVSYIDEFGDEVVSRVTISVSKDKYEYSGEVNIDILSNVHYVALDSSFTIPYIIRPQLAVTVSIDWISSDESVAIVDVFGNIKPMSKGTCTITAINYESGASDTCELRIVDYLQPPTSIEVSKSHVEIGIADSVFIETTVRATIFSNELPTSQEVRWESENPSIAKVDKGYVIGTGQGTTNVYCYSYEKPSLRETIVVNVSGEVTAIKDIELDMYETMLNADEPLAYEYIGWSFVPYNTNQTELVWTSSDENTVKVAVNGRLSIGDAPVLNTPVLIKCTSVSNPEIYRECEVTVVPGDSYIPTITMKESYIRTYVGKTIYISYNISSGYDIQQVLIENAYDGSSTSNTATINSIGKQIQLDTKQSGEYILTISYVSDGAVLASKTCRLIIYEADVEPQFIKNLDVKYSFFNGSYILSYFAVDSDDDLNLTHYINIDDEDYFSSVNPQLMLYEGNEYFYIFGDGLDPGEHTVKIKVVDSNAHESISETKTILTVTSDLKSLCLSATKGEYDEIKNDLIGILERIIKDDKMSVDDKREFLTRYKEFNIGYESLLEILDICVKHINSQIEASQSEIATIAEDLNSDSGVAIAAYSEGDYTNSNFDNVTDMDYYQNECIKALTQRILELEARLDALSNNNNN